MINTITETRPKDSNAGGGKTREEIVQERTKDLLAKLPANFEMPEIRATISKLVGPARLTENKVGLVVPLNIFLF